MCRMKSIAACIKILCHRLLMRIAVTTSRTREPRALRADASRPGADRRRRARRRSTSRYEEALRALGCAVRHVPAADELPDSVFVEDVGDRARRGRDHHAPRRGVAARRARRGRVVCSPSTGRSRPIAAPGTIDGGDVLRLGRTLYVGLLDAHQRGRRAPARSVRRAASATRSSMRADRRLPAPEVGGDGRRRRSRPLQPGLDRRARASTAWTSLRSTPPSRTLPTCCASAHAIVCAAAARAHRSPTCAARGYDVSRRGRLRAGKSRGRRDVLFGDNRSEYELGARSCSRAASSPERATAVTHHDRRSPLPAYVIAMVDVKDPVRYEDYRRLVLPTITAYGGRFVARGGRTEVLEGEWAPRRLVIVEFPSRSSAPRNGGRRPSMPKRRRIRQATSEARSS